MQKLPMFEISSIDKASLRSTRARQVIGSLQRPGSLHDPNTGSHAVQEQALLLCKKRTAAPDFWNSWAKSDDFDFFNLPENAIELAGR